MEDRKTAEDDKYEPEAGLRSGCWASLLAWLFWGSLLFGLVSYCTSCMRYTSDRTTPYGAQSHSSREVYGPVRIGSDSTSSGEQALDRLAECIRDRERQATRITADQVAQMRQFGQQFWVIMPPSWGNPSAMTDDHLLCLMLVSGADPGYAVSIARSRWQPGAAPGFGYGYYTPMAPYGYGYTGAPGVR